MWHTKNSLVSSIFHQCINANFQARNERLATFQSKSFHSVELGCNKLSKSISPEKSIKEMCLFLFGVLIVLEKLELISNPVAMILVRNVHILNSNFVAVSCFKSFNEFTKLPFLFVCSNSTHIWNVNIEMSIQVSFRETIEFMIKQLTHTFIRKLETCTYVFTIVNFIKLQRIEVCLKMSMSHESSNHCHYLESVSLCLSFSHW